MSRPALSASRALEIINLMASSPAQPFTLSEIFQRTGTNVASCHAILNVLVAQGFLNRHPTHKTYRLAPTLVAIGEAVAANDPLLESARAAVRDLNAQLSLEVILTARAGDDIIAVDRAAMPGRPQVSLRIGQRVPLQPPVGGTFLPWANPDEIDTWLARANGTQAEADADRALLALVRRRGFLMALHSPEELAVNRLFAREPSDGGIDEQRRQATELIAAVNSVLYQPAEIDPDERYGLSFLAAPIFDAYGQASYSITLRGFDGPLTGRQVEDLASRLVSSCMQVMQTNNIRVPA